VQQDGFYRPQYEARPTQAVSQAHPLAGPEWYKPEHPGVLFLLGFVAGVVMTVWFQKKVCKT